MEIFTFLWHPQSVSAYMNKFKDKKTFIDLYGNLSFPEGLKKVYFHLFQIISKFKLK